MSIAAESFLGRVLAVFSRRSTGFRPPQARSASLAEEDGPAMFRPAPVPTSALRPESSLGRVNQARDVTGDMKLVVPTLAEATAQLKSVSPQKRLRRRGDLIQLADLFETAHREAEALAHDRVRIDTPPLSGLAHALDVAAVVVLIFALDLDIDIDLNLALEFDLNLTLEVELELDRTLDGDIVLDLARATDGARARARSRSLDLVLVLELARDLADARDNLADVANNFVGADITTVDPAQIDLSWIRWSNETRWPTREWADRIRRASVEQPPGSGLFTVLPEEAPAHSEATLA